MRRSNRASFAFILVTVFLDSIGTGIVFPILPKLFAEFARPGAPSAAYSYGFALSGYSVAIFVCSPWLGRLSDRFGRKPVIVLALTGAAIDYVVAGTTSLLWVLLGARVLAGAFGANISAASAYIADITPAAERGQSFGTLGATVSCGMIFGPAIGGMLGAWGPRTPFLFAGTLSALNAAYGLLALPESLDRGSRRPLFPTGTSSFPGLGGLRRLPFGAALVAGFVLWQMTGMLMSPLLLLFPQRQLGWGATSLGTFLAVVAAGSAAVQAIVPRVAIPRWGERKVVLAGFLLTVAAAVALGFVTTGWQYYAIVLLALIGGAATPALAGHLSRSVDPAQQGEFQGTLNSLGALAGFVGPLLGTFVFGYFTRPQATVTFAGAGFIFGGGLTAIALTCVILGWGTPREIGMEAGQAHEAVRPDAAGSLQNLSGDLQCETPRRRTQRSLRA